MKKIDLRTLSFVISTLVLTFVSQVAGAQQAKVQVIHNSAAVALDTVDIYIDGTKYNDVAFRSATPIIRLTAGTYRFSVNNRNSADSADQSLLNQNISFAANSNNMVMVAGVDDTTLYGSNAEGTDRSLRFIVRKALTYTAAATKTTLSIINGATDMVNMDLVVKPNASTLAIDLDYTDTTGNVITDALSVLLDLKPTAGVTKNSTIRSYAVSLNAYAGKSLTLFLSGFGSTAGDPVGSERYRLCAVDTNGGNAMLFTEVIRFQAIHNSPDTTLDAIDVWFNNTKQVSALAFRAASPMATINEGAYDITVTKKNSPDTATNVIWKTSSFSFVNGRTYIAISSGVLDTTLYTDNPEGKNLSFDFPIYDTYYEGSSATTTVDARFIHGVPDEGMIDVNKLTPAPKAKIANDVSYGNAISGGTVTSLNNTTNVITVTSADSTVIYNTYTFNLTGQGGKAIVIFSSGFKDTTGNPQGVKTKKIFAAFPNGTVQELGVVTSGIQLVHASADTSLKKVDIYVNGAKKWDDFAFRNASAFVPFNAYELLTIAVAPSNSTSSAQAFYTTTMTLDTGKSYYAILVGLRSTTGYAANPEGIDRSFAIVQYTGAVTKAVMTKNVDLMFFNGITDAPAVKSIGSNKGVSMPLYLSKGDSYKEFHGTYIPHPAYNDLLFPVKADVADTLLFNATGNFFGHDGQTGLVFASGFIKDATNRLGSLRDLFVVWPDGTVDSMHYYTPVGVKENVLNETTIECYPNPAKDQFTIRLEVKSNTRITAEMYDLTGKMVLKATQSFTSGLNGMDMNVSDLKNGMYILKLISGEQSVCRKINIVK